jgi:hypothetical protein
MLLVAVGLLCGLVPLGAQSSAPGPAAPGRDTILRDQLKADLYFLAGDAMRGRLTGSPEYYLAADWIQSRFERLGLATSVQRFDLIRARLAEGNSLEIVTPRIGSRRGRLREEFHPQIFSPSAEASGAVVFAGFGIRAPKLNWVDYQEADVKGRVVLLLDGDPGADDPASPFDGVVNSDWGTGLRKVQALQAAGAKAVLIVNGRAEANRSSFRAGSHGTWPDQPAHLQSYTLATYAERIHIPALQISPALAELLLGGGPLSKWREESERARGKAVALETEVRLRTAVERQVVEDRNLIATIEGSDPTLKQEAVIVSAHYDHNGATGDQIFNGADDNGSGTVALLEIAEAYALAAAQGQRPKRTVIFAAWGSEERCCGPLLGAWAWLEHPLWPLDKTVAVLNMDMIGRNEEVPPGGGARFRGLAEQTAASNANRFNLIGWSYSPELGALVEQASRGLDLQPLRRYDNNRSNLLRRSDQWPFLQRGVPAVWFHTGLHPDYHTTFDRPERIDYGKMERVARLVHQSSWMLANQPGRPKMLDPRPIPKLEQ